MAAKTKGQTGKKDKKDKLDKKIKPDLGLHLPKLFLYTALGTVFLLFVTFLFALAGFLAFPPLTCAAGAVLSALAGIGTYRAALYLSDTRSVPLSRIFAGMSALLIGYIHLCVVMNIVETVGEDALTLAELITDFMPSVTGAFQNYFLHPALLWEDYLYYGNGWAALMLVAPLSMLGCSQLSVGGVRKRLTKTMFADYEDAEPENGEDGESQPMKNKGERTYAASR